MRQLFKRFLIGALGLYFTSTLFPALSLPAKFWEFMLIALTFSLSELILKPVLKLLLLPLSVLTFGLIGALADVLVLYLLDLLLPALAVTAVRFTLFGVSFLLESLLAYLFLAAVLQFIQTFIRWLIS